MTKKFFLAIFAIFAFGIFANAQSVESLKSEIAEKKAQTDAIAKQIADLEKKILEFPGWRYGASGIVGLDLAGASNWVTNPFGKDASSTTIGFAGNGFVNYNADKYFWRNTGSVLLKWQELDQGNPDVDTEFQQISDLLKINSLAGYKLTEVIALSGSAAFETPTFISDKDEVDKVAYLDLGVGATYNPNESFVLMVHPINYRFIFAENDSQFESSLGCKIFADYNKEIMKGIVFGSTLDGFISYKGSAEFEDAAGVKEDVSLHTFNWSNRLGVSLIKNLSVGLTVNTRWNQQEINQYNSPLVGDEKLKLSTTQWSWLLGLGYNLTF